MNPKDIEIAEEVVIQFGKYKDQTLENVPTWYLKWLAESCDCEFLCIAADTVYQERER